MYADSAAGVGGVGGAGGGAAPYSRVIVAKRGARAGGAGGAGAGVRARGVLLRRAARREC